MPIEVVATTEPFALVERSELVIPVIPRFVVVALVKALFPENVLLSPSNVEDAALIVMLLEPLKETPLIVLAVWSAVAVFALPPMLKEAAVPVMLVPTSVEGVPRFGVTSVGDVAKTAVPEPVSSVSAPARFAEEKEPRTVAFPVEVIAPVRLALVVTVPAVSPAAVPVSPVPAPEKELAKMVPEAERLVVDALASVVFPVTFKVDPIPKAPVTVKAPMLVDEALEMKPAPKVWRPVQVLEFARSVEEAALMV